MRWFAVSFTTCCAVLALGGCERDLAPSPEPTRAAPAQPAPASNVQSAPAPRAHAMAGGACGPEEKAGCACGNKAGGCGSGCQGGGAEMAKAGGGCGCGGRAKAPAADGPVTPITEAKIGDRTLCPVMNTVFIVKDDSPKVEHDGKTYWFCCDGCVTKFKENPQSFLTT